MDEDRAGKENVLATQAFANPENISEPQTGFAKA